MDFESLKKKVLELKGKIEEKTKKVVEVSAQKLQKSNFTLDTNEKIEEFINKSEQKTFTSKETWETKVFNKRVIVVFWDSKTEFFKEALYMFPVLLAKTFSQNIPIKLVDVSIEKIDIKKFNITETPCLAVFQNKEIYKTIYWKEKVLSIVKNLSLDINKTIEEM